MKLGNLHFNPDNRTFCIPLFVCADNVCECGWLCPGQAGRASSSVLSSVCFLLRISWSPVWPWIYCAATEDLKLLISLHPPPNTRTLGMCHHSFSLWNRAHCVAQARLELRIILPQHPRVLGLELCATTNLLRKVTLNIYSRIQLKLIYYRRATGNEDVLKGKAKESRGFLKSRPTFPKSMPAALPSVVVPGDCLKLCAVTLAGQKILLANGPMAGPQLSILRCHGDCLTSCGAQTPVSSFFSLESGSQTWVFIRVTWSSCEPVGRYWAPPSWRFCLEKLKLGSLRELALLSSSEGFYWSML